MTLFQKILTTTGIAGAIAAFFLRQKGKEILMGSKVLQRQRADGIDDRLQKALDAWEATGPFPIEVGFDGGLRTAQRQLELWQQGRDAKGNIVDKTKVVTNAKSPADGPHPRGGAVDLWPAWDGKAHPGSKPMTADEQSHYNTMVGFFEAQGLKNGRNFPGLADWPHWEVPDWQSLPLPQDSTPMV